MKIEPYKERGDGQYPFVAVGVRWVAENEEDARILREMAKAGMVTHGNAKGNA